MVDTRIYYLAPARKTVSHFFSTIFLVQMLSIALSKQALANTYAYCKPSVSHELLWALGAGISRLGKPERKQMRKVF